MNANNPEQVNGNESDGELKICKSKSIGNRSIFARLCLLMPPHSDLGLFVKWI